MCAWPPAVTHGDAVVIETGPCAGYQLGVHQDEPAVGVVLGGACFARHIGTDAVTAANGRTSAHVHHAAHHVQQGLSHLDRHGGFGQRGGEGFQHNAMAVVHAGDQHRRNVAAFVGQRGIAGHHFFQRDRAGAQGQRRHFVQRTLAHPHGAGQRRNLVRPHFHHHLRGDGVFRQRQTPRQCHGLTADTRAIAGLPQGAIGLRDAEQLVKKNVSGLGAILKRCAIHKRLEGRARLAARLADVVKLIKAKVPAAHPRQHMARGWVFGHEAGLDTRFVIAQLLHEVCVGQQCCHRLAVCLTCADSGFVLAAVLDQRQHKARRCFQHLPFFRCPATAQAPITVSYCLQPVGLSVYRAVGHFLQARINRGVQHQTIGVNVVVVAVGPFNEPAAHLLRKVRRGAWRLGLPLKVNLQRLGFKRVELRCGQRARLDHLAQHRVAPGHSALRLEHRVVVAGALEHANQRGGLQHVELVG